MTGRSTCLLFPSIEYGVQIERTVLGPDSFLVGLRRRVSREWRRTLEMLCVMMSNGYFLTRKDIARESDDDTPKADFKVSI